MVVIGLTGRMGTGKSEVSRILHDLGAVVISADQIGHEAYLPHTQAWQEVVVAFGQELLQPNGEINRQKLGDLVFRDTEALARLNAILHPRMAQIMEERIRELERQGAQVVALEAALLIEADWTRLVDEVWVVTGPDELAPLRVHTRNGLSEEAIRARIQAQLSQEKQLRHAQVVIQNAGDLEELRRTVTDLWETRILARKASDASR